MIVRKASLIFLETFPATNQEGVVWFACLALFPLLWTFAGPSRTLLLCLVGMDV